MQIPTGKRKTFQENHFQQITKVNKNNDSIMRMPIESFATEPPMPEFLCVRIVLDIPIEPCRGQGEND